MALTCQAANWHVCRLLSQAPVATMQAQEQRSADARMLAQAAALQRVRERSALSSGYCLPVDLNPGYSFAPGARHNGWGTSCCLQTFCAVWVPYGSVALHASR